MASYKKTKLDETITQQGSQRYKVLQDICILKIVICERLRSYQNKVHILLHISSLDTYPYYITNVDRGIFFALQYIIRLSLMVGSVI